MRVIGGEASGRRLRTPKGRATRPITDRVKETLFAILGERVRSARALDLYAGSGAIGIEALSRGAATCTFVERDHAALAALAGNLAEVGVADRATIVAGSVERFLGQPGGNRFDLVFVDPPYDAHAILATLAHLAPLLERGATVVVKHFWRTQVPVPDGMGAWRQRRFGETSLTFMEQAT